MFHKAQKYDMTCIRKINGSTLKVWNVGLYLPFTGCFFSISEMKSVGIFHFWADYNQLLLNCAEKVRGKNNTCIVYALFIYSISECFECSQRETKTKRLIVGLFSRKIDDLTLFQISERFRFGFRNLPSTLWRAVCVSVCIPCTYV